MTAPQGTQPTTKTNVFDYESTYIACKLPTFATDLGEHVGKDGASVTVPGPIWPTDYLQLRYGC